MKLQERTRCSVAPARAVATGQSGELDRRAAVRMPAAPPQLKTVYWFMLTYVVNKGMVAHRWA